MTLFFLVVGLEAKRELDLGELRERRRLAIPVLAALGGMAVPVAIYLAFNAGGAGRARLGRGDVDRHRLRARRARAADAALGHAPARLPADARGRRRPVRAARDRGRLHGARLGGRRSRSRSALFARAARRCATLPAWRGAGVDRGRRSGCGSRCSKSGIDPVISGLAVGLATSAYPPSREDLERATSWRARFASSRRRSSRARRSRACLGDLAQRATAVRPAPVDELRDRAAVRARERRRPRHRARCCATRSRSPITLGILVGYVVGKPLGIAGASWLASRPALHGPRSPLSPPLLAAGGGVRGNRLHGLAADLEPRLPRARSWKRRSSARSARWCSRRLLAWPCCRSSDGSRRACARARSPARPRTSSTSAEDVDPERDHIRGPRRRAGHARRVRRLRVPLLRAGRAGRSASCSPSIGDDVRYVWRHLPLNDVHPNAQLARRGIRGGRRAGTLLGDARRPARAPGRAAPAGSRATTPRRSGSTPSASSTSCAAASTPARVSEDVASADESGVSGTPTLLHQRAPPLRRLRHRHAQHRRDRRAPARSKPGARDSGRMSTSVRAPKAAA